MNRDYFLLDPSGQPESGPYTEAELLDLLDSGEVGPDERCLHEPTGRIHPAGAVFQVIRPEPPEPAAPVAWKPAPFPEPPEESPSRPESPPRPRLLYRGNPAVLTYWRSIALAATCIGGGLATYQRVPSMLAMGLLAGSGILLLAILHRLRTQYYITTARVEVLRGLISRSSRELRIPDIRAINVVRTGLTGLIGIGAITFSSAAGDDDDVVFTDVSGASRLKQLVRQLQDAAGSLREP
jgi:hypothetical protein